ncbi:MAG TPA: DUF1501 domain-containing protein [Planctomycetota bacterium]|nr:DUF1501 domain-containing protein [Planctomycetota bacterium]
MHTRQAACEEYGRWSRRQLLRDATLGAGALLAGPSWLPRVVPAPAGAAGGARRDVLVYVFLRGGLDGLSFVPPHGDGDYYAARPVLGVPPPGSIGGALDLDGFFGLLPAAAPLHALFAEGRLAFVHAVGTDDHTRSHFDAFNKVELGIAGLPIGSAQDGWLARHLGLVAPLADGPLRAAALRDVLPITLFGAPRTLPIPDPAAFEFPGDPATAAARQAAIVAMYQGLPAPLGPAAIDTLDTIALLGTVDFGAPPQNGAAYPATPFGAQLRACATIIRAGLPVEALMLDYLGFDHHSEQGPLDGDLALLSDDVARAIVAFDTDLGPLIDQVTLVAHSEFGRRVAQNASLGADHGFGGVLLALGGHVQGGQVLADWPGLAPAALVDGDLAVTTDLRDVLGEILVKRLAASPADLAAIFPAHTVTFPGLVS